jgi:hypothetical protein
MENSGFNDVACFANVQWISCENILEQFNVLTPLQEFLVKKEKITAYSMKRGNVTCRRVYPKVSRLAAWSENCKWHSSLPLSAVVSLFCESV